MNVPQVQCLCKAILVLVYHKEVIVSLCVMGYVIFISYMCLGAIFSEDVRHTLHYLITTSHSTYYDSITSVFTKALYSIMHASACLVFLIVSLFGLYISYPVVVLLLIYSRVYNRIQHFRAMQLLMKHLDYKLIDFSAAALIVACIGVLVIGLTIVFYHYTVQGILVGVGAALPVAKVKLKLTLRQCVHILLHTSNSWRQILKHIKQSSDTSKLLLHYYRLTRTLELTMNSLHVNYLTSVDVYCQYVISQKYTSLHIIHCKKWIKSTTNVHYKSALQYGESPNAADIYGNTPLMYMFQTFKHPIFSSRVVAQVISVLKDHIHAGLDLGKLMSGERISFQFRTILKAYLCSEDIEINKAQVVKFFYEAGYQFFDWDEELDPRFIWREIQRHQQLPLSLLRTAANKIRITLQPNCIVGLKHLKLHHGELFNSPNLPHRLKQVVSLHNIIDQDVTKIITR